MIEGAQVLWRAFRQVNQRGYVYIWANILWFILSLPLITAPAAWGALVYLSRQMQLTPTSNLSDFWQAFRENLWRGAGLALVNLIVIVINISNLLAYRDVSGPFILLLRGVWLLTLAIWLMLQFYAWPLFYEMNEPRLLGALRNAGVMLLRNPLFSLTLLAGICLIVTLSSVLFVAWFLLTGGVLAALATTAVFDRLAAVGMRAPLDAPVLPDSGDPDADIV